MLSDRVGIIHVANIWIYTAASREVICSGTEKEHVQNRAKNPKSEPGEGQASIAVLSIQLEKENLGRGL